MLSSLHSRGKNLAQVCARICILGLIGTSLKDSQIYSGLTCVTLNIRLFLSNACSDWINVHAVPAVKFNILTIINFTSALLRKISDKEHE